MIPAEKEAWLLQADKQPFPSNSETEMQIYSKYIADINFLRWEYWYELAKIS